MVAGCYASGSFRANLIAVDGSPTGFRVQVPDQPFLTAYLDAIEPEELFGPCQAVADEGKHALEALPAFTGNARSGWLVDATGRRECKIWSEETDRAFGCDGALVRLGLELYARAVLAPWEGRLCAAPGEALDGRAPAWVDFLRKGHVALLTQLGAVELPRLGAVRTGPMGTLFPVGRFSNAALVAEVFRVQGPGGVALNPRVAVSDPVLSAYLAAFLPMELAAICEAVRWRNTHELKATPEAMKGVGVDRVGWTLASLGEQVVLASEDEQTTDLSRIDLLAVLSLYADAVLAIYEGTAVAATREPAQGKVSPWVGKLRRVRAQMGGLVSPSWVAA